MERFKLVYDEISWGLTDREIVNLLVKLKYINCFGKTKYEYREISTEFLDRLTVYKEEEIISLLKGKFLHDREKTRISRIVRKRLIAG